MDLNRLVNLVLNVVIRRFVNFGIDKGFHLLRRTPPAEGGDAAAEPPSREARDLARKARQAAKIARRLGR